MPHCSIVPALTVVTCCSLAAWVVIAFGRDLFWRTRPRLPQAPPPASWPAVTVVVPARNESEVLPVTLPTLLAQDYPGPVRVVLVDDHSEDGTAAVACSLGDGRDRPGPTLSVLQAPERPQGWAGKLWAVSQGVAAAGDSQWLLLTDADIAHPPGSLGALVAAAEALGVDQLSLMARLHVRSGWERLLVPAFVYFFAMLYPFGRVGRPPARRAAAAGGCVLVRTAALRAAGGVQAIRGAVIDDVSLAQAVARAGGRVWLGFADDVVSVRAERGLRPLWQMVTRSAFTQLRHSATALAGTVAGLVLVFVVPPVGVAIGLATHSPVAASTAGAAWALMGGTYLPMQRYHGLGAWWAVTLPMAAALYLAMTVDSARRHWTGRGAAWKGRSYGSSHP